MMLSLFIASLGFSRKVVAWSGDILKRSVIVTLHKKFETGCQHNTSTEMQKELLHHC